MPKTTETTTEQQSAESPIKQVMTKLDNIKESLRGVIRDLSDTFEHLKVIEKEKKTTDREIETVREKLRDIQSVKI